MRALPLQPAYYLSTPQQSSNLPYLSPQSNHQPGALHLELEPLPYCPHLEHVLPALSRIEYDHFSSLLDSPITRLPPCVRSLSSAKFAQH
ncbi:hypothetical protein V6N13_148992 [Hibiscus sabdariffa]